MAGIECLRSLRNLGDTSAWRTPPHPSIQPRPPSAPASAAAPRSGIPWSARASTCWPTSPSRSPWPCFSASPPASCEDAALPRRGDRAGDGAPAAHRRPPGAAAPGGDLAVRPLPRPADARQPGRPVAGRRAADGSAAARHHAPGRPGPARDLGPPDPRPCPRTWRAVRFGGPERGVLRGRHRPWLVALAAGAPPGGPAGPLPPPGRARGMGRAGLHLPRPQGTLAAVLGGTRLFGAVLPAPRAQSQRLRRSPCSTSSSPASSWPPWSSAAAACGALPSPTASGTSPSPACSRCR